MHNLLAIVGLPQIHHNSLRRELNKKGVTFARKYSSCCYADRCTVYLIEDATSDPPEAILCLYWANLNSHGFAGLQ